MHSLQNLRTLSEPSHTVHTHYLKLPPPPPPPPQKKFSRQNPAEGQDAVLASHTFVLKSTRGNNVENPATPPQRGE